MAGNPRHVKMPFCRILREIRPGGSRVFPTPGLGYGTPVSVSALMSTISAASKTPPGRIRRLGTIAVSAGALAYVAHRVDVRGVVDALSGVRLDLLVAVFCLHAAGQLLSARKWGVLAAALGFRRSYADYARFYFIGMFVNLLGPSTLGGDITRALYLGDTGRRALAATSVLYDRVSGVLVLVVIGLAALLAFPQYGLPRAMSVIAAGAMAALLLSWWIVPRAAALLLPPDHRLRRFIREQMAPFYSDAVLLTEVASYSVAFHLVEVTAQYVMARSFGLTVPFSYCLIFHPAVTLLAAVPVSVAGLGVREAGYVFFLELVGVPGGTALTMGLLWSAVLMAGGLIGGGLLLLGGQRARGAGA